MLQLQHNYNFESEKLVVDYICLNIQGSIDTKPIARFLFSIGFNSYTYLNDIFQEKEYTFSHKYKVSFRQYTYDPENKRFWDGTKIHFKGENAAYLFNFIKEHKFDWNIFELQITSLSRFDIYYFRPSKPTESNQQIKDFMQASKKAIQEKSKRRIVKFDPNKEPYIIKIGRRYHSLNYYRVYQKRKRINYNVYSELKDGLEFELELTKKLPQSVQQLFFHNQIEEFENILTRHFFKQSCQNFGLNFCYSDWLSKTIRKIIERPKLNPGLVTDYLVQSQFDQREYFFQLLQFLSFIRNLKGVKQILDNQVYYVVEFPVVDFISFQKKDRKSTYQRRKVLHFLRSLQGLPPLVEKFSEIEYRSAIMFPLLKLRKENRLWILRLAIGEQLFFYEYPFVFPDSFLRFQNKYDFLLKFQIIQLFSKNSLEKKFHVGDFMQQFLIPNKKRTQIKKQILDIFDEFKKYYLIQPKIVIVLKDDSKKELDLRVTKLTLSLLNQSKYILFYEIIDSKFIDSKFK